MRMNGSKRSWWFTIAKGRSPVSCSAQSFSVSSSESASGFSASTAFPAARAYETCSWWCGFGEATQMRSSSGRSHSAR